MDTKHSNKKLFKELDLDLTQGTIKDYLWIIK